MRGFINNEWDRDNLEFLLGIRSEDFREWHAQADPDDLQYAEELMDAYGRELSMRSQALLVECKLDTSNNLDAQVVIDKIMKL